MVSIVITTYNHEKYIAQCLDSILMQETNFPFEIILGEDESTDNTRAICNRYAEKYPDKIKLFLRSRKDVIKINGKPTGRFNFIENLKACKGKYIALCDGDDYWTDALKLQKQVDFLEGNPDYVMCFHLCEFLRSGKNCVNEVSKQSANSANYELTIENLLKYWNIPTAAVVYRNNLITDYPDWFTNVASGDIALLMLLYEKGKFKLIEEHMSVYRISGDGVSKSHVNYKMIYYRAKLYTYLNEYFNYKYEKEIFDALNHIYLKFSEKKINENTVKQSHWSGLKKKAKIILKNLKKKKYVFISCFVYI